MSVSILFWIALFDMLLLGILYLYLLFVVNFVVYMFCGRVKKKKNILLTTP